MLLILAESSLAVLMAFRLHLCASCHCVLSCRVVQFLKLASYSKSVRCKARERDWNPVFGQSWWWFSLTHNSFKHSATFYWVSQQVWHWFIISDRRGLQVKYFSLCSLTYFCYPFWSPCSCSTIEFEHTWKSFSYLTDSHI